MSRRSLTLELLCERLTPALLVTFAPAVTPPISFEPLGLGVYRTQELPDASQVPGILSIEEDAQIRTEQIPSDPSFASQYALEQIQAPAGWDVATGTGKTIVAVIDSGVDYTHPDLAKNIWTNPGEVAGNGIDDDRNGFIDDIHGYDFAENDSDPQDAFGHGTHVAGILGAVGNNTQGVAGVVWKTQIMPLRFLDDRGNGSTSDAIRALSYAVANGAKISNNSWGGAINSPALTTAIERAKAAGHIIVAAAGNSSSDLSRTTNYPASFAATYDNVISVAATDYQDRLATFSNYGPTLTLAAPGDSILSTVPGGRYGTKTGSSMATPFVSGALALLWDQHPDWNATQIVEHLKTHSDTLSALNGKTNNGNRLNVAKLLGGVASPPVVPPTAPPTSPGTPPVVVPLPPPRGFVPTPVAPLPVARRDAIAVGTEAPGQANVIIANRDGTTRETLLIPGNDFLGGARVASADLTGDGVPEVILATNPGVPGRVQVLDGVTHNTIWDILPFEQSFTGGVFVAVGDVTSDGVPDLAISADQGGGPRIRIFDGSRYTQIADFFGIDDPNFRGGARAAIGDMNGDGIGDLAMAAGFGGGPRVAAYDGLSLGQTQPQKLFGDFFAYESTLRNGVYLAVGDINTDGIADLIVGAGPGGGPRVAVFDGNELRANQQKMIANFFAGDTSQRNGVRVVAKDIDGDPAIDVVIGTTGRYAAYTGKSLLASDTPTSGFGFDQRITPSDREVFVG